MRSPSWFRSPLALWSTSLFIAASGALAVAAAPVDAAPLPPPAEVVSVTSVSNLLAIDQHQAAYMGSSVVINLTANLTLPTGTA